MNIHADQRHLKTFQIVNRSRPAYRITCGVCISHSLDRSRVLITMPSLREHPTQTNEMHVNKYMQCLLQPPRFETNMNHFLTNRNNPQAIGTAIELSGEPVTSQNVHQCVFALGISSYPVTEPANLDRNNAAFQPGHPTRVN